MALSEADNLGYKTHIINDRQNDSVPPQRLERFLPEEKLRRKQLSGFSRCLNTVYRIHHVPQYGGPTLYKRLKTLFSDVPLIEMAKIFKLSIHTFFSKCTDQLLPEDHHKAVQIIHPDLEIYLKKWARVRQLSFLQDLLMCKGLSNPVPDGMITKAYEKHRQALSSVGKSPEEFLDDFREVLRYFGEEFKKQNFDRTSCPSVRGYYGWKKSQGGLFSALRQQFRPKGFRKRWTERRDPIVLHIEGEPGIGKSKILKEVSVLLSKDFGYSDCNEAIYNRTVTSDHWDGYRGQLISSIDDFGCIHERQASDFGTLIQMCSDQEFVLPMADLRDKGIRFNSNFVFLSTNGLTTNGGAYNMSELAYHYALLRRVSPTYRLTRDHRFRYHMVKYEFNEKQQWQQTRSFEGDWRTIAKILRNELIERFDKLDNQVFQPIEKSIYEKIGYGYYFPMSPPDRLPTCEAHAISEPLKVRLITKNEPNTWILKPVQKAMWETLKKFKVFSLTNCPDIDIARLFQGGKWLVSGDYEAATDNLNFDIMETAIEILSQYVPYDYLKDWMRWEGGAHIIEYPSYTGLEPIKQTRGQLMGSLLSFPILCLANYTTVARAYYKARGGDILDMLKHDNPPLFINGDDILFTCHGKKDNLYLFWKANAQSIGLKLSIGKSYISKEFGLINSQMILSYRGKQNKKTPWHRVPTVKVERRFGDTLAEMHSIVQICSGKMKSYKRMKATEFDFKLALDYLPKSMVISLNKDVLLCTPESLSLPKDLGGIGKLEEGYEPTLKDKELYAFRVFRHRPDKIIKKIDDDTLIVRLPKKVIEKVNEETFSNSLLGNLNDKVTQFTIKPYREMIDIDNHLSLDRDCGFPWKEFREFRAWYKTTKLRDTVRNMDLLKAPKLLEWKSELVTCSRKEFDFITKVLCKSIFDW